MAAKPFIPKMPTNTIVDGKQHKSHPGQTNEEPALRIKLHQEVTNNEFLVVYWEV